MSRTTDKYRKIFKDRAINDKAPDYEVRISSKQQGISKYIKYTAGLLLDKKLEFVILKASGQACKECVHVAENLKKHHYKFTSRKQN